jgi:hypothetical protein
MNTYKSFIYIFIPLVLLIVSCKTQQVSEGISTQIPDNYPVAEQAIQDSSNWALAGWKEFFKDAHLQNLIETGLENNQDVLKTLQNWGGCPKSAELPEFTPEDLENTPWMAWETRTPIYPLRFLRIKKYRTLTGILF